MKVEEERICLRIASSGLFDISGIDPSGSAARELVKNRLLISRPVHYSVPFGNKMQGDLFLFAMVLKVRLIA